MKSSKIEVGKSYNFIHPKSLRIFKGLVVSKVMNLKYNKFEYCVEHKTSYIFITDPVISNNEEQLLS